jgi:hypothetical protein
MPSKTASTIKAENTYKAFANLLVNVYLLRFGVEDAIKCEAEVVTDIRGVPMLNAE